MQTPVQTIEQVISDIRSGVAKVTQTGIIRCTGSSPDYEYNVTWPHTEPGYAWIYQTDDIANALGTDATQTYLRIEREYI